MQNIMSFKMRELLDIDGVIVWHLANAIIIYKKRFPSSYSVLIHFCTCMYRVCPFLFRCSFGYKSFSYISTSK